MLKNIKFQYKILIFPILFTFIFIISFLITDYFQKENKILLNKAQGVYLPSIQACSKLNNKLTMVQRSLQDAVASADEEKLENIDFVVQDMDSLCTELSSKTKNNYYKDTISYKINNYYENAKETSSSMIAGDFTDELSEKITIMLSQYNELDSTLNFLEKDSQKQANLHFQNIEKNNQKSSNANIIIIVTGIILFLIVSYYIGLAVVSPLKEVIAFMKRISNKEIDFQIKEKRKDEIGELYSSINEVNKNFIDIITNINETASAVLSAGDQLSSISLEIAQSANEQAATTEEVSTSMEQMLAMISSNTENAEITGKTSQQSAHEMEESNQIFIRTIESVSEISEKIGVISEIAEKTDMLSINAAIEAARAGEVGKGFSIVAREIRKLADKTKTASDEINKLSKNGKDISKLAGEKLSKTIPKIIKSAELVNNIVVASKEQQSGVEMINISIQQLTEITNSNSASAEEMSTSAEELSAQAEQLKNLISIFKIGDLEKEEKVTENEKIAVKEEDSNQKNDGFEIDLSDNENSDDNFEKY